MGKTAKIVGGIVLGLFTLGLIINAKDMARYVRMSTM